jgi:hypothetical protein
VLIARGGCTHPVVGVNNGVNDGVRYRHPLGKDVYTPMTPQMMGLLWRMRLEVGTWGELAYLAGLRRRQLRRATRLECQVISMTLLDRLCQASNVGHVGEFIWFTAEDLVELGFWKPIKYLNGRPRTKSDEDLRRAAAVRRRARRSRERAELRKKRAWARELERRVEVEIERINWPDHDEEW